MELTFNELTIAADALRDYRTELLAAIRTNDGDLTAIPNKIAYEIATTLEARTRMAMTEKMATVS